MDIVIWLRSLGLQRYEAAFRENEIDEAVLPSLTHETLKWGHGGWTPAEAAMPLLLCVTTGACRLHPSRQHLSCHRLQHPSAIIVPSLAPRHARVLSARSLPLAHRPSRAPAKAHD
jgi:SAM domain (Sterile alpha motif)